MKLLNRRVILGSLVLATTAIMSILVYAPAGNSKSEDQPKAFRWRVPKAHFETVKNELRFDGDVRHETNAKGVPLVFIFVGIVLLPYLANAVLALRREIVYGGIVIDTRGSEIIINNDKRLDAGVLLVISPSGTKFYEKDEIGDPTELVAALLKGK